jgi:hypothetical protein
MTMDSCSGPSGRRWILIVLAAAGVAVLPACGGEERLSRGAFEERLQNVERWGNTRYARLTEQAMRLRPDQPLTDEVKQGMRRYAHGLARAADRLDSLNPPRRAEQETVKLINALRKRASGFEQAARKQRTTLRELEREHSITRAGDRIDRVFEALREDGFRSLSPDRDDRHALAHSRAENRSGAAHHDGAYYRALSRRYRATSSIRCCDHGR